MRVSGFDLEVKLENGMPHVRVSMKDGTVVVDTTAVSVTGLRNLAAVFEKASLLASQQMERYGEGLWREMQRERDARAKADKP